MVHGFPAVVAAHQVLRVVFAGPHRTATLLLRERGAAAAWTEVFVPYLQALGRQW
jgi:hypothetical protein